jgi:hypothetical protein
LLVRANEENMRRDRSPTCRNKQHGSGRYGRPLAAAAIFASAGLTASASFADEGGVSFWVPGLYGSLAAVPGSPGWSLSAIYYHTTVSAGSDVARAREITIGRFNPTLNQSLSATVNADADIGFVNPMYTFATPVLGGQAALGFAAIVGHSTTTLSGTVTASIPPFAFVRSDSITDSVTGVGDLYPMATLKWHQDVHNFMIYGTGDIPVGTYSATSLANMGIGHGAADAGAGYTYLDDKAGHEFSAVAGFTYNLTNTSTNYQNGVDFHLDWGASQYLSKQVFIGAVGYLYNQVSPDGGSGDKVGAFESRVIGVGPQIGYLFPVGNLQGFLGLKVYREFENANRPDGWNGWVTFSISPAAPTSSSSMLTKAARHN